MGHSLLESLPICRLLLRSASLLVPGRSRADWLAEWQAELWHVLRSQDDGRDRRLTRALCTSAPLPSASARFRMRGGFAKIMRSRRFVRRCVRFARHGSPAMCLLSLAGWTAASLMLALCLPTARKAMIPPPYPDADNLILISPDGTSMSPLPSIRLADYRSWQTSTRPLFTELAYYQPLMKHVHIAPHRTAELSVIRASASLFDLLKFPSFALKVQEDPQQIQGMLLSENAWHEYFDDDPAIAGRVVEVAGRQVRIAAGCSPGPVAPAWPRRCLDGG